MQWLRQLTAALVIASASIAGIAQQKSSVAAARPESLFIGPGDLLEVNVLREPDLTQHVRVRDSGDITLPLVGQISVAGASPSGAADRIAEALRNGQYLKQPQVSVTIVEFGTQSVAVLGEVARPGTVTINTPRSLLDVLAMAGGLTDKADRHITIERGGPWGEKISVFLPNGADAELRADVSVHPGDRILVPKAGIVYVLGDVGRPGGYVMQDDSKLTVMQALALAAGINRTAAEKRARLLRKGKNGYAEVPIPLHAMERGQSPDLQLKADDILYIPFSARKNLMLGGSNVLASAGSALIYAKP
jgi:polysaccharide export outer membrane protein